MKQVKIVPIEVGGSTIPKAEEKLTWLVNQGWKIVATISGSLSSGYVILEREIETTQR